VEAALQLGDMYMRQEQYDRAERAYAKMAELAQDGPTLAQARYGESMALLELEQTDEARNLLEQALDQAGETRAAYPIQLGLGRVYERQGQTQQAQELYRSVVQNAQGEPGAEALYRLGSLLLDQNQPRAAITELSRMTTLFTGYPQWMARGFLLQARSYRSLGETGEAVRLYDRVIQSYADTPYAQTARQEKEAL
jgi:tetratricopeptide (TPR) repeat protein